jgi:hypothetical protein
MRAGPFNRDRALGSPIGYFVTLTQRCTTRIGELQRQPAKDLLPGLAARAAAELTVDNQRNRARPRPLRAAGV